MTIKTFNTAEEAFNDLKKSYDGIKLSIKELFKDGDHCPGFKFSDKLKFNTKIKHLGIECGIAENADTIVLIAKDKKDRFISRGLNKKYYKGTLPNYCNEQISVTIEEWLICGLHQTQDEGWFHLAHIFMIEQSDKLMGAVRVLD